MNDNELDQRVAAANPVSDGFVTTLPLSVSEAHLVQTILATEEAKRPTRTRRLLVPIMSAAALIIGIVGFVGTGGGSGGGTAWAAPLLDIANAAPRYLVVADGWKVTRADEFAAAQGEMTFGKGRQTLELRWTPVDRYGSLVDDRKHSAQHSEAASVGGEPATLFQYDGSTDFTTIWRHGDHTVEARAMFPTVGDYRRVLGLLRTVDVDTWLRAMPDSVIKPTNRAAAVDQMLADMPHPPGFDAAALRDSVTVSDRYQLGAAVAGAVACGWIDSWVRATDEGDAAAARTAVDALSSSHRWAVLHEMNPDGDYPEVLWQLADAIRDGSSVPGGKQDPVRDMYKPALGCK
jgi:hypothetical protein